MLVNLARSVSVLTPTAGIDPVWVGVQRIIKVERIPTESGLLLMMSIVYFPFFNRSALPLKRGAGGDLPGFASAILYLENNL
jgi:hypothetical protein